MAVSFAASPSYIHWGTGAFVGSSNPWSAAGRVFFTTDGLLIGKRDAFSNAASEFAVDTNGGKLRFANGASNIGQSTQTFTSSAWNTFTLACDSSSANGTLNGSAIGDDLASFSNDYTARGSGGEIIQMGRLVTEGVGQFAGALAEMAVWNAKLTTAEQAIYSAGYSPLLIRPDALIMYAPLIGRYSSEIDLIGGRTGTLTTTGNAAHPRIIMPRRYRGAAIATTPPPPETLFAQACL